MPKQISNAIIKDLDNGKYKFRCSDYHGRITITQGGLTLGQWSTMRCSVHRRSINDRRSVSTNINDFAFERVKDTVTI